jgi:hypothetical protein
MPIREKRGFFGGSKLEFQCPTCGATMPVTRAALEGHKKVACKSCAALSALSASDAALLRKS